MKTISTSSMLIAPVLLLSSAMTLAATDRDAVQACSEAIVSSIEENQEAEVSLIIDESKLSPNHRLSGQTVFELDASSTSTNEVVQKFRCRVNRFAQVQMLRVLPEDVPVAEVRVRS